MGTVTTRTALRQTTLAQAAALLPEPWPEIDGLTAQVFLDAGFNQGGCELFLAALGERHSVEWLISALKSSAQTAWANLAVDDAFGWSLYFHQGHFPFPPEPFPAEHPTAWLPWAAGLGPSEIAAGNLPDEDVMRAMAALRGHDLIARYRP